MSLDFRATGLVGPAAVVAALLAPFAFLLGAQPWQLGVAALAPAAALLILAIWMPANWPHRQFGMANSVTLFRLGLAGLLLAQVFGHAPNTGADPSASPVFWTTMPLTWTIVTVAALAAALDGADGWLARRAGLDGPVGARFDMESDAFLILVLSLLAWRSGAAGAWILASGLLRYAFVGAGWIWHWLRAPLPFSQRRRAACGLQVVTLVACLTPDLPGVAAPALAAIGLVALVVSFTIDILALAPPAITLRMQQLGTAVGPPVLLNALLSFDNLWPTPAIRPDLRLAPEFVGIWLALIGIQMLGARHPRLARRALGALVIVTTMVVIGRYFDVTAPALFGRPISLYWDGRELPSIAGQLLADRPVWQIAGAALVIAAAVGLLFAGLRRLLALNLRFAVPAVRHSRIARALTAGMLLLIGANLAGAQSTWPWVSRPLLPGWWQQVRVAVQALSPHQIETTLSPSPRFDGDLAPLKGRDFYLIFSESYGASTLDDPHFSKPLQADRDRLRQRIASAGAGVVSIRTRSPTFAGGSWLAHAALLSGVDTRNPAHYQLLLTTPRDNLVRMFARNGFRTIGLMPGLRASWLEGGFYGFDQILDAARLDYRGPEFGYWRIPDQYALAKVDAEAPAVGAPRFIFFPTLGSHIPFRPLPPYQRDWSRLLGPTPYDPEPLARSLGAKPDWLNLREPWIDAMRYSYHWLADLVDRTRERQATLMVLGDHQPAASVVGRNASWEVPVHLISSDVALLARFRALGFVDGLEPEGPVTLDMHDLTRVLLKGAASSASAPHAPACGAIRPGRRQRLSHARDSSRPCRHGRPAGYRTAGTDSEARCRRAPSCRRAPCRSVQGVMPSAFRRPARHRSAARRSMESTDSARRS